MSKDQLRLLRPADVDLAGLTAAIGEALQGGGPVAPLPDDPVEADRALAMLQPKRPVTEPGAAVIISTSGSTGVPKGVVLSAEAIRASAAATHERLGGPGRWLLALPPHYVAGLMVIARATVAGMPVAQVGSDLAGLTQALDRDPDQRSYLSLVPTQLNRALNVPDLADALTRVDAIVLGGAPATDDLLARATARGITVVTSYGMSETCGGCVYDGRPLPGVEVTLAGSDSDDTIDPDIAPAAGLPSHTKATDTDAETGLHADSQEDDQGRILLGGPVVFSGYRLRPDLTAATLIDNTVRTNDRGRFVDGRLQVLGRYDDVIISGGLKIDLAAVERAARDWPALAGGDIAVIGVPHPDWGTELIAVAETSRRTAGGEPPTLPQLHTHLQGRLARHERPKKLIMMSKLPRTSGGKIDRRRLRTELSGEPS